MHFFHGIPFFYCWRHNRTLEKMHSNQTPDLNLSGNEKLRRIYHNYSWHFDLKVASVSNNPKVLSTFYIEKIFKIFSSILSFSVKNDPTYLDLIVGFSWTINNQNFHLVFHRSSTDYSIKVSNWVAWQLHNLQSKARN